jgi:L-fucose isomerase-like protein
MVLVFVASGGTEGQFVEHFTELPRPVYLLTDGKHNSLAASLEISAWVRDQGTHAEILHGEPEQVVDRIEAIAAVEHALRRIAGMNIGFVGKPSDWLVASSIDRARVGDRLQLQFDDVPLEELYEWIDAASIDEAEAVATETQRASQASVEPTRAALVEAAKIYVGLRDLVRDRGLSALSLRCFDLIGRYNNTGCLALARLNDEGIVAGCEGDQQALLSVLLSQELTGEVPFLANPAGIDVERNRIDFAHCMIPTRAVRSFVLRSHFESGVGVAIDGELPEGPVTVVRMGRGDLSLGWYSEGRLVGRGRREDRCRTQAALELDRSVRYFLEHPVANHHVVVPGRWGARFDELFKRVGVSFAGSAEVSGAAASS